MAAQFSDDAYNKYLTDPTKGGTLIGNWFEERSIREATGEGRSVPQRHIPRSGLLTDWTKVPDCGPRKQDNTFERTYGPPYSVKHVPQSKVIGAGEEDLTGENQCPHMVQAEGRIARKGQRELACIVARREAAEAMEQEEEKERERQANERMFETSSGVVHTKPDEAAAEKAAFLRKSCKNEILHGPRPHRSIALMNSGMDVTSNVHYSNMEAITHPRMSLVDPAMRNDMKVSACQGFQTFGKNSEFSKPTAECFLGIAKDDELEKLFSSEKANDKVRCRGGIVPQAAPFANVPSLTLLKDKIHKRIESTMGPYGYVTLRHRLYDCSDNEGFVQKADVIALFRSDLGLTPEEANDKELNVWLTGLITMKQKELRISSLMSSLRPALAQATKRRIMEAFTAMGPTNDVVPLAAWLGSIQNAELRLVMAHAFGAEDESSVADVPLSEVTLVELIADLAPLIDIDALLQPGDN
jgi:hypothetical protein